MLMLTFLNICPAFTYLGVFVTKELPPSQNRQRAGEATPTNLSPRELRSAAAGPRDGSSPSLHQGGNVITVAVAAHGSPAAAAGAAAADAAPAPGGQGCPKEAIPIYDDTRLVRLNVGF